MADALTPNQARLKAFVASRIEASVSMSPEEADDFLMKWSDYVQGQFNQLERWACDDEDEECPEHLIGLDAWDLSSARDELASAGGARLRASKVRAA